MCQKSQLAELGLFDAKVPRYTSYPTAPNFGAEIDSAHYSRWVKAIPAGSRISLYIHIPFCRNLCWFCMCRTQGIRSDSPITAYLDALIQEIALIGALLPDGVTVSRLHLGGGSPTILTPDLIRRLSIALADLAPLDPNAQVSIEIDPNEFDQTRCEALLEAGLTHATIGIQDFNANVQQAIGRKLEFELAQQTMEMLRSAGLSSIGTDMLFGLPHQDHDAIQRSTTQLIELQPDRVALYGYVHLPALIRRQAMIPSEALPTPQNRLSQFETASGMLRQAGYRAIGMDHFALPQDGLSKAQTCGQLRRGFRGYVDDPCDFLIGLGASAVSRFPQGYVQNQSSTARYMSAVGRNQLASIRGHAFDKEDLLRGYMIEALLCEFRIRRAEISARFPHQLARFEALATDAATRFAGIVTHDSEGISLPEQGRSLARIVARHFDAYDSACASHSSAA